MLTGVLSTLALITAVIHIRAEYKGPRAHVYIFKPLTTSLIILIALGPAGNVTPFYRYAIAGGLLFSLGGDVFLMLPSDRFIAGLVSFLVAHLFYIAAFAGETGFYLSPWPLIPLLLYGGVIYALLSPHLGKMRAPVVIYMAAILVMGWQAWGRWIGSGQWGAQLAAIGAGLFVISDSVLALNRFRRPFPSARLLTMGAYYAAQWLIALSAVGADLF